MTTIEKQESTEKTYMDYLTDRKENNSPDSPIPDYKKRHKLTADELHANIAATSKTLDAMAPVDATKLQAKDVIINKSALVDEVDQILASPVQDAPYILRCAAKEMEARQSTYDMPEGERSMQATVEMFAALTGIELTETQGWKFMVLLKMVRAEYNGYRKDDYVDGAAYFALSGESAAKE